MQYQSSYGWILAELWMRSANPKSANSWAPSFHYRKSENFLGRASPQIASPQPLLLILRRKSRYLRTCGNLKAANYKEKVGSENRKSAKCHTCRWSANLTNYLSPQVADLRFADRPSLIFKGIAQEAFFSTEFHPRMTKQDFDAFALFRISFILLCVYAGKMQLQYCTWGRAMHSKNITIDKTRRWVQEKFCIVHDSTLSPTQIFTYVNVPRWELL